MNIKYTFLLLFVVTWVNAKDKLSKIDFKDSLNKWLSEAQELEAKYRTTEYYSSEVSILEKMIDCMNKKGSHSFANANSCYEEKELQEYAEKLGQGKRAYVEIGKMLSFCKIRP